METHKKVQALGALFTALVFAGCFQDPVATQPENALAKGPQDPNIAMLVASGLPEAYITVTVDPDHDTAYLYEKPLTAAQQKQGYATIRYAYSKKTLDNARAQANASREASANKEATPSLNTLIPAPYKMKIPESQAAAASNQASLSKSSQTRYDHASTWLDVKALTEVYNIKVYITRTGGFKLGPGWIEGVLEAMAKWNAVKGTHVSFVETNDINDCDVRIRSAYASSGGATVWMTPDHLVDPPPAVGMSGAEIYFNAGFETVFPHNQKVGMAMVSLGNMVNIYHTNQEGYNWEGGTMANIAGTSSSDAASLFHTPMGPSVNPVFSTDDLRAIRQLYPLNGSTGLDASNTLWIAGSESNIQIAHNVVDYQQVGDTLIWLAENGEMWMRIGTNTFNQYFNAANYSVSFRASESHMVIRRGDGSIVYRPLAGGSWVPRAVPAGDYRVYANRLVYVTYNTNGAPTIYSLTLAAGSNPVVEWAGSPGDWIDDFQIQGTRLFFAVGGSVWEKDLGISNFNLAHYGVPYNPATRIQVSESHVAIHVWSGGYDGTIYTRPLSGGGWTYAQNEVYNGDQYDLCGDKVAVIGQGYYLKLRDLTTGTTHHSWDMLNGSAHTVRLSGPMCDYITKIDHASGMVMTKYGLGNGTEYLQYAWGARLGLR